MLKSFFESSFRKLKKIQNAGMKTKSQAGFTLLEILVVFGILGFLIATLVPRVLERVDRANLEKTRLAMSQIVENISLFQNDCQKMPSDIKFLVEPDPECKRWGPNPYMKNLPKDGWGRDFVYETDGITYKVKSLGKDGKPGGKNKIDQDIDSDEI